MENLTKREKEILIALVADCINYGLTEKEALTYIKARLGKKYPGMPIIGEKKIVDSGSYAKEYLSYLRIGFVIKHIQIIEVVEMIQKDTIRDSLIEKDKPEEIRNKNESRQLRFEIRENAKLLQELWELQL